MDGLNDAINDKNVLDDKNLVPNFVFPFLFRGIMYPTIDSWVHYPKALKASQLERTLLFLVPEISYVQEIGFFLQWSKRLYQYISVICK